LAQKYFSGNARVKAMAQINFGTPLQKHVLKLLLENTFSVQLILALKDLCSKFSRFTVPAFNI
jgi:hypothetical protein